MLIIFSNLEQLALMSKEIVKQIREHEKKLGKYCIY